MYAIHPGYVTSKNDGDLHYIGVAQLVRLYKLRAGEYITWDRNRPETYLGRNKEDYIHLYPRYDSDYRRPEEYHG